MYNNRTQYCMGLVQTAIHGYRRHFVFFVSLTVCLSHASFRRGPVLVLLITHFFDIEQVTFLR